MKLINLFKKVKIESLIDLKNLEVGSIYTDTRKIKKNSLFIALRKEGAGDGHNYIDEAFKKGASYVLAEENPSQNKKIIKVENTILASAKIAANFYNHPSKKLKLIGIIGTNGKTSTSYILESILCASGKKVGVIGTVNYRYDNKVFKSNFTTPEALEIQSILNDMLSCGVKYVIMEVSSHSIYLNRIKECFFDIGIFSNFSQDHLDFHKTLENYWECKKSFFTHHLQEGCKKKKAIAVINIENEKGYELAKDLKGLQKILVGKDGDIKAKNTKFNINGISGNLDLFGKKIPFNTKAIGKHNLENVLCAVSSAYLLKIKSADIEKGIVKFNVPGRLEKVYDKDFFVFIDYAHTPDALYNVLKTLKEYKKAKLICVFGCGGNRDKNKRSKMGAIAEKYSDVSIITSDNPRNEEPLDIIKDIQKGFKDKKKYKVIENRKEAIFHSIRMAKENDIVLIAGKGHENYQIIKNEVKDFDDKKVSLESIKKVKNEKLRNSTTFNSFPSSSLGTS